MKKLFYGLGAIAAVATPIVAVVSCGSKDTNHSDVIFEFVKANETPSASLKGDWKGTENYDRAVYVFDADSKALAGILKVASASSVHELILKHSTSLDTIESALRNALVKNTDNKFKDIIEAEKSLNGTQSVLSLATFGGEDSSSNTDATKFDTRIELTLNGLSKELVNEFFDKVQPVLTGLEKNIWDTIKAAIN